MSQEQKSPDFLFPAPRPSIAIAGETARFPVRRIYCVGRNYADHAREMGADPDQEPPFFFSKPADAVMPNDAEIPYPPRTNNLHHEVELVVAIGKQGRDIAPSAAADFIYGYAVGNDLTRRDLQKAAKDKGQPWDTAKGFDHSAPVSALHKAAKVGSLSRGRIWLKVNDALRQDADLSDLIWPVPDIISYLSGFFTLYPGDLIFTGTPAGVGPLAPGDRIEAGIDGVDILRSRIVA